MKKKDHKPARPEPPDDYFHFDGVYIGGPPPSSAFAYPRARKRGDSWRPKSTEHEQKLRYVSRNSEEFRLARLFDDLDDD